MVRFIVYEQATEERAYIVAAGLAQDSKPQNAITGSQFKEVDTGKEFLFDEVSGLWLEQGSGRTPITGATVTLGSAVSYDGTEKTKSVSSVVLGETTLTANTDYIVVNNKGVEPGNYEMQIVGIGDYCGVISEAWSIGKGTGSVTASPDTLSLTAGGDAGESTLTVVGDGDVSASSSDEDVATVEISGTTVTVTPVAEGSATVTVTVAGTDHYTSGSDTISVTVAEESGGDS